MIVNYSAIKKYISYFFAFLIMLIPAIICFYYIHLYGVNVLYWDQWEFSTTFQKFYQTGQLSFWDLFAQHNEHRFFFPRLIMLMTASLSSYDVKFEMFINWAMLLCILTILFFYFLKNFGIEKIFLFIPVSFLLFNLRQYENLLWGWQISLYLSVLFFIVAVFLLEKSKKIDIYFILAIFSAIICSFSFGNALLIWGIGCIQLIWYAVIADRKKCFFIFLKIVIWLLAGILTTILYFYDFYQSPVHPTPDFWLERPIAALSYVSAFIGGAFGINAIAALLTGIVILLFFLYISYHFFKQQPKSFFGMSLLLFAILSAIIISLGRAGFGIEQANASRYATFTSLGLIGLYFLVLQLQYKNEKIIQFFITFIILGLFFSYTESIYAGKEEYQKKQLAFYYLLNLNQIPDDKIANYLHPIPSHVKAKYDFLLKNNLNSFKEVFFNEKADKVQHKNILHSVALNNTVLSYDKINSFNSEKDYITLAGWALDYDENKTLLGVMLYINGNKIRTKHSIARPDVAAHFNNSSYLYSGFEVMLPLDFLKKENTLSLKFILQDGSIYYKEKNYLISFN